MTPLRFTRAAVRDVQRIAEELRKRRSLAAANEFLDRLESVVDLLRRYPDIGHSREDLPNRNILSFPVGVEFAMFFRRRRSGITVLAVRPSRSDLSRLKF